MHLYPHPSFFHVGNALLHALLHEAVRRPYCLIAPLPPDPYPVPQASREYRKAQEADQMNQMYNNINMQNFYEYVCMC